MARGRGRELAFQALFQAEQGQSPLKEAWKDLRMEASQGYPWKDDVDDDEEKDTNQQAINTEAYDAETLDFSEKLLNHFDDNRERIDSTLENELEGWTFKQMAQTDLSVLRLALAEIFYEDTPDEVSINMAVRIAKKYGGEESGKFVNGVLGRLFRKLAAEKNDQKDSKEVEQANVNVTTDVKEETVASATEAVTTETVATEDPMVETVEAIIDSLDDKGTQNS